MTEHVTPSGHRARTFINENGVWYGYILVPEGHPLNGVPADAVDYPVSVDYAGPFPAGGGVDRTKASEHTPGWWVGIDSFHLGTCPGVSTSEWVRTVDTLSTVIAAYGKGYDAEEQCS